MSLNATEIEQASSISDFLMLWFQHGVLNPADEAVLHHYYGSYIRHFDKRMQEHYAHQTADIMPWLARQQAPRVLEVGCGCGTESLWFALNNARVTGIDVSRERLRVAHARLDALRTALPDHTLDCSFQFESVLDHQPDQPYDAIWMEQAFHHIEPREEAVHAIARLLRPGGRVFISEVNAWNPLLQLQLLRRRGFRTMGTFIDDNGVERPYGIERVLTSTGMRRVFARAGIQNERATHWRVFPNHRLFGPLKGVERNMPGVLRPVFTHYNWVGKKKG